MINSVFSFNFKNCMCFFNKTRKQRVFYEKRLLSIQNTIDIKILPFTSFLPLTDIFPKNNHVAEWSVYVIGKNKRLVVAQDNLELSEESMLAKKYDNVINEKNGIFFDTVFEMIISGHESQFLMVVKEKLYFANTYSFLNEDKKAIGGILFVRLYSSMSELVPKHDDKSLSKQSFRKSKEYDRALNEMRKANMN